MYKVDQNAFYAEIGRLDVVLSVEGNYPYTTRFLARHGSVEKGRTVNHTNKPSDYYLRYKHEVQP